MARYPGKIIFACLFALGLAACEPPLRAELMALGDDVEEREMLGCIYDFAARNHGRERADTMARDLIEASEKNRDGNINLKALGQAAGHIDIFIGAATVCE